jgi:hypothetical protein
MAVRPSANVLAGHLCHPGKKPLPMLDRRFDSALSYFMWIEAARYDLPNSLLNAGRLGRDDEARCEIEKVRPAALGHGADDGQAAETILARSEIASLYRGQNKPDMRTVVELAEFLTADPS